jgi:hypothetical protein
LSGFAVEEVAGDLLESDGITGFHGGAWLEGNTISN